MKGRGSSLSLILAFLSGYVDTATFVHMGGLFVAHVTGNFVLLGATLAGAGIEGEHGQSATLQLIAFPVFFASAALAAALAGRIGVARQTPALLWLTVALVLGVGAAGLSLAANEAVLAMLLVVAMGLLNAAQRMDAGLGPPFTVMTGNVTSLAIETARRVRLAPRPADPGAGAGGAPPLMLWLVLAFALGCLLGALGQTIAGLGAMLVPGLLLAIRLLLR